MRFIEQWVGHETKLILLGLVILDLFSFGAHLFGLTTYLFSAICAFVGYISLKKQDWLFPLALAEIISTSNGHSADIFISGVPIGPRIVIFAALVIVMAHRAIKKKTPLNHTTPMIILSAWVIFSAIRGIVEGYPLKDVYLDANGYFAVLYVAAGYISQKTSKNTHLIFEAVGAAIAWLVAKSLLLLFVFGHISPKILHFINIWVRDTRFGELTYQTGNLYRIFLQSQWFVVPAILLTVSYIWHTKGAKKENALWLFLVAFIATILISMSRTFWLALIVAGLILASLYLEKIASVLKSVPILLFATIGSLAVLLNILAVPIYMNGSPNGLAELFSKRASEISDAALDSRRQLLPELNDAIMERPLSGYGLGKRLSYVTKDPRYIQMHETDLVTTYAFEWGWHDIWVKFGLFGVGLFIYFLFYLSILLFINSKTDC